MKTLVVCDISYVKDWFLVMRFWSLIDDWFCEVMLLLTLGGQTGQVPPVRPQVMRRSDWLARRSDRQIPIRCRFRVVLSVLDISFGDLTSR